jgi:signal peptidase I
LIRGSVERRSERFSIRAARAALRALWFAVIPALLAGLVVRYLLVSGRAPGFIAGLWKEYPVQLSVVVFLIFVSVVRYWHLYAPGGRYLSRLPLTLATLGRREDLAVRAAALELHEWLSKPRVQRRLERRLGPERWQAFPAALTELESALDEDAARVTAAQRAISALISPAPRVRALFRAGLFATLVLVAGALSLLLKHQVFRFYEVERTSMLPGLEPGDQIVASQLAYRFGSHEPRRGDLVVFRKSITGAEDELLKRVIGLPGDLIEMRGSHPVINGWRVPSCDAGLYVYWNDGAEVLGRTRVEFLEDRSYLTVMGPSNVAFEAYRVKPGEVFVLGDNRKRSVDSRTWDQGRPAGLPLAAIVGRIDRVFLKHEDDAPTWRSLLRRPGLELHAPGLDMSTLREGVSSCLAQRPKETAPPKPAEPPREARNSTGATP